MKYKILSLNDDRIATKSEIRRNLLNLEEVLEPAAVNGNQIYPALELSRRNVSLSPLWSNPKRGELGVWLSNYDAWIQVAELNEPLIVFEDDATIRDGFLEKLNKLIKELPSDWDFISLWVPENQLMDYRYSLWYENGIPRINGVLPDHIPSSFDFGAERAALVYQGYGMVSLVYSPTGGKKAAALAREHGITGPVDCWIYEQAHMRRLNGYAPKPNYADIVEYHNWGGLSHVQQTERI